ncbi:MAG: DUF2330 domain-containing protein [Actinomycetota bacterium]
MKRLVIIPIVLCFVIATSAAALACGGLIGPNGNVNLLKTTTLAGYAGGVEHYITSFSFAGGGGAFGSIVPLPGIPTSVVRGGDWTLQRLIKETQPPVERLAFDAGVALAAKAESAEVILETTIDALDLTVLKGGGDQVGEWAKNNGFTLPPDAPEVLDFYAARSPIFLAARFDADAAAARGQNLGEGTPIHLSIPTDNPWVPLRILALGKQAQEQVQADVYLLTPGRPGLMALTPGLTLDRSEEASRSLIADLRSDQGMDWLPPSGMWLSYFKVDARAGQLSYDLAVDVAGGVPSALDVGTKPAQAPPDAPSAPATAGLPMWFLVLLAGLVAGLGTAVGRLGMRRGGA